MTFIALLLVCAPAALSVAVLLLRKAPPPAMGPKSTYKSDTRTGCSFTHTKSQSDAFFSTRCSVRGMN
jgi:hypothetical protein